jgi:hypothetical protein
LRRPTLSITTVVIFILTAHALASAQTRPADAPAPSANAQATRAESSNSDEDYELNIDQRRINEADFHAETAIRAEGARGFRLNVGVALRARDIDASLRNVRGRVRFHSTLGPALTRLLDALRIPEVQPGGFTPPPP